jgi:hypothetical protein
MVFKSSEWAEFRCGPLPVVAQKRVEACPGQLSSRKACANICCHFCIGKESAVLCSQCAADLPEGSQLCLKCGQPAGLPLKTDVGDQSATERNVKDRFVKDRSAEVIAVKPEPPRMRSRRRGLVVLLLVLLLLGLIIFIAASENPLAQEIQDLAGWKHDQIILDSTFSIGPHTFRYYKFSLPPGSAHVAVIGQFSAESSGKRKTQDENKHQEQDKNQERNTESSAGPGGERAANRDQPGDAGIEVFVQTESAFTSWQNGRASSSLYDSALVPAGTVRADIPAGAGVYYLVFSNKSSLTFSKAVHATVLLRYRSWLRRALTREH